MILSDENYKQIIKSVDNKLDTNKKTNTVFPMNTPKETSLKKTIGGKL